MMKVQCLRIGIIPKLLLLRVIIKEKTKESNPFMMSTIGPHFSVMDTKMRINNPAGAFLYCCYGIYIENMY